MPLKPEDRAAYQRDYRARKAGQLTPVTEEEISVALGGDIAAEFVEPARQVYVPPVDAGMRLMNQRLLARTAERDALRAEVKHLKGLAAERATEILRLTDELATRPLPGTNPVNAIPADPWKAQRYAETFGAGDEANATRVAGSHASGPWTPEFRPAPKSVPATKPKGRR